ncbi:MAG: hypothetical protein FWD83_07005 [Promicromonosporaceae bacterium]|nr:hypothetical protein [Promicromonosporaceae bacterium]
MATRDNLKHAIRASCEIVQQPGVIIIGSQSILATWPEAELPEVALQSMELDVCPLADDAAESLADVLDGALGELSLFHETHGFYVDGVGKHTAILPGGFEQRLVAVTDPDTKGYLGYCLDPHDLCVAKLAANRDKDRTFVAALINAHLVDPKVIDERLFWTDLTDHQLTAARSFLAEYATTWNVLGLTAHTPSASLGSPSAPQVYDLVRQVRETTTEHLRDMTPAQREARELDGRHSPSSGSAVQGPGR